MSKKILIHSLIFSPDGVSTAYLYNDIALQFKNKGYDVVVLSTTPHYNLVKAQLKKQPLKWKIWGLYKESIFNGIRVIHIPQKKFKSTFLRILGFLYWHIASFFLGLVQRNVDVILSPSPPLTIGVINLWLAKIKGCKVIYNVQEIYPDILKKKEGFIFNTLKKIESYVYNKSTAVTTIDNVFYNTIVDRFDDKSKLFIIPNFVDTSLYNLKNGNTSILNKDLFPKTESLKVIYAGNIGFAQDWETLIELAKKTKNNKIEFYVIGEGVMKEYIESEILQFQLKNIHLLPYQSRELMPHILAYSDIQFIFMNPKMDMQGFPSKVYTIMACSKPLLVCSSISSPIVNFLNSYNCAKLETITDFEDKITDMSKWLTETTRDNLKEMGKIGYDAIQAKYTKEIVTQQYVDLVELIL